MYPFIPLIINRFPYLQEGMEICTRNHTVGIKALRATQPSMCSSSLSAGLVSMRKLAVCFNYEGTWHRNVNSKNYE
jgi:hypothetical protein